MLIPPADLTTTLVQEHGNPVANGGLDEVFAIGLPLFGILAVLAAIGTGVDCWALHRRPRPRHRRHASMDPEQLDPLIARGPGASKAEENQPVLLWLAAATTSVASLVATAVLGSDPSGKTTLCLFQAAIAFLFFGIYWDLSVRARHKARIPPSRTLDPRHLPPLQHRPRAERPRATCPEWLPLAAFGAMLIPVISFFGPLIPSMTAPPTPSFDTLEIRFALGVFSVFGGLLVVAWIAERRQDRRRQVGHCQRTRRRTSGILTATAAAADRA